jgi:cytochrome c oxidase subunit 3
MCYVRSRRAKDFTPTRFTVLGAASLYWHFVDVVWVILFGLVYLL